MTVQEVEQHDVLSPLNIDTIQSNLMKKVKDPFWSWNLRCGHLNFGGLKKLTKKIGNQSLENLSSI